MLVCLAGNKHFNSTSVSILTVSIPTVSILTVSIQSPSRTGASSVLNDFSAGRVSQGGSLAAA